MNIRYFVCLFCLIALNLSSASALSIEAAYRAIPHRQTTYRSVKSPLPGAQSQQLEKFFHLVDLAMVERVDTLLWFQSGGKSGQQIENYERDIARIVQNIGKLPLPDEADEAQRLILRAINEQREFFQNWNQQLLKLPGPRRASAFSQQKNHAKIRSSSQKLQVAYRNLKSIFPGESPHNTKSFFDHLCALDFV